MIWVTYKSQMSKKPNHLTNLHKYSVSFLYASQTYYLVEVDNLEENFDTSLCKNSISGLQITM